MSKQNNNRKSTPNITQVNQGASKEEANTPGGRRRGLISVGGNTASLGSVKASRHEAPIDDHHQNITKTDFSKNFSPKINLDKLQMPLGLKFRPLVATSDVPHDHVQAQLLGLPGALKMDYTTSQKYFGASARDRFFDRYKWMDHQRDITLNNPTEEFRKLYFECEKTDPSKNQAFAPVRPLPSIPDDESRASSFQSRFKANMSASGQANESYRLREAARRSGRDSPDDIDELDEARMLEEIGWKGWEELEEEDEEELEAARFDDEEIPIFNPRVLSISNECRLENTVSDNKLAATQNEYKEHYNRMNSRPTTPTTTISQKGKSPRVNNSNGDESANESKERPKSASAQTNNLDSSNTAAGRGLQGVRAQRRLRSASSANRKNRSNMSSDTTGPSDSASMQRARKFVQSSADHFSDLILEDMMRKKNVTAVQEGAFPTQGEEGGSSLRWANHTSHNKRSDLSVVTASTVSTLGLLLGQRGLNGAASDVTKDILESPRSRFIAGCIERKINPRVSLLLRKNMSKQLNLQHLGMGDVLAALLAECVTSLPFVQSINVADNMLTDDGLGPLILAAKDISGLLELNLSLNEIGPIAAKALFDYLVAPTCPLERLILNSADVDDFECGRFIEAVKQNRSLRELDLSSNKIGTAENLNTVMPDIVTGGEAIADLLRDPQCRLSKLNLSWNMIRLGGAIDMAESLAVNDTLTYLDLSFNSLSTEGGVTLGVSLLKNKSLQTLILASNSIDSVACFTICAGIIENRSLRRVALDGNPIGKTGMQALMLIPVLCGNRVKVTAARCNCNIKDPNCWFDFDKLLRDYDLDMSNGFERAVAIILLHLIAGHHSYIFSRYFHEPNSIPGFNKIANPNMIVEQDDKMSSKNKKKDTKKDTSKKKPEKKGVKQGNKESKEAKEEKKKIDRATKAMAELQAKREAQKLADQQSLSSGKFKLIDLVQITSEERVLYFDDRQKEVLSSLEKMRMAASNIQMAVRLFQEVDTDGSGELDKEELGKLMAKMGFKMSEKRLTELMSQYDVDMGGKIELHEFLMLLKSQHQEATARIKELTQSPVMALKSDKGTRYTPPETGALHCTVIDGFAKKKHYRVLTACDREYIDEVAEGVGGGNALLAASLQGTKLRLDEGLTVAETMLMDSGDKVATVKKLLLQMNDFEDARHLITSIIDQDRADMVRLRRDLGPMLKAILGNPNGYYVLDLSKEIDRLTLEKLLEISATNAVNRCEDSKIGYGRVGDLSQKGSSDGYPQNGFSSFRNEMFNGEPMTMSAAFCSPIPLSGTLDFDFSCTPRPARNALVLSDLRVVKILLHHFLLEPRDAAVALHRLHYAKLQADKTLGCNGVTHFECPMDRARQIGECCELFYNNIHLRCRQWQDTLQKEASTEVDEPSGQLKDLFERDKQFSIPLMVSDWFVRLEQAEFEKAEKERIEREKILEKERRLVARYQIYGTGNYTAANERGGANGDHGGGNSIATDTDEEGNNGNGDDGSDVSTDEDENSSENSDNDSNDNEEEEDDSSDNNKEEEEEEESRIEDNSDEDDEEHNGEDMSEDNQTKRQRRLEQKQRLAEKKALQQQAKKAKHDQAKEIKRQKRAQQREAMDALRRDFGEDVADEDYANNDTNSGFHNMNNKNEEDDEDGNWEKEFELMKEAMRKKREAEELQLRQQQMALEHQDPNYEARLAAGQAMQAKRRRNVAHHASFCITMSEPDEFMEKFKQLLQSPQIQSGAKAHRIVDMLEDMFARTYLCCRHVALIVECFAFHGYFKQTKYHGTYRVDLIIGLFARIVDLHNFEFVMEVLSPAEAACLYCRLGWLNLYNPCKPEGSWELDMSRREERILAKTLCVLATHEPGDNWTFQTFRWMRSMESMPGWQLTQPWLTEEGMPMRGLVNITYYSGEGKGKKDCKPYVAFRKSLLNLVLINEEEIVEESMRSRPPPAVSIGDRAFNRHYQIWDSYLAPDFIDPNRKR